MEEPEKLSKERIASLAKLVFIAAGQGDKQSRKILDEEIDEIMISIHTVAKELGLIDKSFDVVFIGSNFNNKEVFRDVIAGRLRKKYPKVKVLDMDKPPVDGAIKIALDNLEMKI